MTITSLIFIATCSVQSERVLLASGFELLLGNEEWLEWNSIPPLDNPFPKSKDILGWEYANGSNPSYGGADTFYPTWSLDDNIYTPWTDGQVSGVNSNSGSGSSLTYMSTTGINRHFTN